MLIKKFELTLISLKAITVGMLVIVAWHFVGFWMLHIVSAENPSLSNTRETGL